ncbi:hypothetical protein DCAR_0103357 [Daucus carota subsp. sativus]|uniref:Uncharacterized protein n=1 Tax=Daucus carota subsp. sativus TaxID=79200 RepID=A0A166HXP7_DAUCS|nr:hypothetical protein DCAR_0103357 [Daucus carota subsp. sativus]
MRIGERHKAGVTAFSKTAAGYSNVDVNAAIKYGVAVGNTPNNKMINQISPLPGLLVNLLKVQIMGVIGAGCIGSAYAGIMIEGLKMNLICYDLYQATRRKVCHRHVRVRY